MAFMTLAVNSRGNLENKNSIQANVSHEKYAL